MTSSSTVLLLQHNQTCINVERLPCMVAEGNAKACFEIHTFVDAVRKTTKDFVLSDQEWLEATIERYKKACDDYNTRLRAGLNRKYDGKAVFKEKKAPVLKLMFRTEKQNYLCRDVEPVVVCQAAQHIDTNDFALVVEQQNADAKHFEQHGLRVLRCKIELLPGNIPAMPRTSREAALYPDLYFEQHKKLQTIDCQPVSQRHLQRLDALSLALSRHFAMSIPVSFNISQDGKDREQQCFINLRFYGKGMHDIREISDAVDKAIEDDGTFRAKVTIFEAVVGDSFRAMDWGWIDHEEQK